MADDILKRQTMQAIVETLKPNGAFIGERFFPVVTEPTEESVWDVVNPGEGLASIRGVDAEAKIIDGKKFDRKMFSVTDMAAKRRLNITDIRAVREAGEKAVVEGSLTSQMAARARRRITTELSRVREAVDNRLEWARIQALQGELTYSDPSRSIEIDIDYGIPGGQKLVSPSVAWDTIATSNPINDLQTWMDTVVDATGVVPGQIVLSRKALSYAAQSAALRTYFQYTKPLLTANEVAAMFSDRLGLEVTIYEARYLNDSNVWTRFLAENVMIMLPSTDQMSGASRFGDTAVVPHPHNNHTGTYYVWQKEETDPWGIEVGAGLTALPRIYQPGTILTAELY